MQITTSHQQKIKRLEEEKQQIEERLRRMKRAAQTAERKKQTRAKIILGALILSNHPKLVPQLIALASPQDAGLLCSAFPSAAKEVPAIAASRL